MSNLARIEREVMRLAPEEREQLALAAWESLGDGSNAAVNEMLDPEGLEVAKNRDRSLSSGAERSIGHSEFLKRISTNE